MASQPVTTRIVLASRPSGKPVAANFQLERETVRDLAQGEVLLQTLYLSLDPYMRGRMDDAKSYAEPVEIGGVMEGARFRGSHAAATLRLRRAISSSRIPAGRATRFPMVRACRSSIRKLHR